MSTGNVNNAETLHTKPDALVEENAVVVRAAILDRGTHALKHLLRRCGRKIDVQPPNDSAHVGLKLPEARLSGRSRWHDQRRSRAKNHSLAARHRGNVTLRNQVHRLEERG